MKKIAIIGSGGLGREILGIIESINRQKETWHFVGFYDDNLSNKIVNGFPVIDKIESLNLIEEELNIVIGIGNPKIRELIFNKINNSKIVFPTLIHPSVVMYSEDTINIGKGVVIGANCVLTVNVEVGNQVYINTASVLSHDASIGDFSVLMPTVSISAGAEIGKSVYIGNGVKIDQPISIEDYSHIKSGTVLSK